MKARTVFYCTECGNETPKWAGKCPACGAWNTVVERPPEAAPKKSRGLGRAASAMPAAVGGSRRARPVTDLETAAEIRFPTGMGELDRVLGGGAVKGSLVLVGGAPGIGKSTLMLQICSKLCEFSKVLYVSGEESEHQLKLRAGRLNVESEQLFVISETCLGDVLETVAQEQPDVLIIDSIQTLYNDALDSPAGSVGQVKDCTMALMQLAKGREITVFVIGHVNKEGSIAGPKVLEHMVDCVLYFEGDQHSSYRILRAAKNRFGATNEIGVFEMEDAGLHEVENPSEMLLDGRPADTPGTCVTCVMEGVRPVLAEIQALIAPSSYGTPRRTSNGFDYNRAAMLIAVLEKRGGLKLSACDTYLNIIGGLWLDEPAADLAAAVALASSYLDQPVPGDLVAIGEVGLTGELRSVSQLNQRVNEVRRLGFKRCLIPERRSQTIRAPEGLELIPVRDIGEALRAVLRRRG
ncbi:DNA repair protein RadA [uncultured Oscillibacter sp.]|uniref:DNA repair protein RadA n=1 Tax=uncultured Oscillibacter sp. TaxID=876091 RepID=UPI0025F770DD|nr:DNA repair protein RadA [uncultured Oscillibacter sp.]